MIRARSRLSRTPFAVAVAVAVGLLAPAVPLAAQSRLAPPGSPARGWVIDGAGLLPEETVSRLDRRLAEHERATSDQVVVETVLSLEGRPLEEFSLAEAKRLRLGQKGRDNGVLLLVALHDHAIRIEVGYGLEGRLPDAFCARILRREVLPKFRQEDYAGGIEAGVDAILAALEGQVEPAWLDRVPGVGSSVERLRGWFAGLPDLSVFDQLFYGLFLFLFGPILALIPFAWMRSSRLQAGLGLGLFALVAAPLVVRYPYLLGGTVFVGLVLALGRLLVRAAHRASARAAAGGWASGGGSPWSSAASSSSSSDFSSSSSSSFSGGGGDFGGGGASGHW